MNLSLKKKLALKQRECSRYQSIILALASTFI